MKIHGCNDCYIILYAWLIKSHNFTFLNSFYHIFLRFVSCNYLVLISDAVITRPMSKKTYESNLHSIISTVIYMSLPFEERIAKEMSI